MCNIQKLRTELRLNADKNRQKTTKRFFKTKKGEYSEHDKFLGISNPAVRQITKKYHNCNLEQLQKLIISPYNEERFCVLVLLIYHFQKQKDELMTKKDIYDFYIKNIDYINNWNLVDISAPHIVGEYLLLCTSKDTKEKLSLLVKSNSQWQRRICIVSTWAFIKRDDYSYTLKYAKRLLLDREDLMHKAIGWMLREVWKRDNEVCELFLIKHYSILPRTTLRYAIERMPEQKRKQFLCEDF
jgi:3-methyladenine DNA glycosylase AlkD